MLLHLIVTIKQYNILYNYITLIIIIYYYFKLIYVLKPRDGNPFKTLMIARGFFILLEVCIFIQEPFNYLQMLVPLTIEVILCSIYLFDVEIFTEYLTEEEFINAEKERERTN